MVKREKIVSRNSFIPSTSIKSQIQTERFKKNTPIPLFSFDAALPSIIQFIFRISSKKAKNQQSKDLLLYLSTKEIIGQQKKHKFKSEEFKRHRSPRKRQPVLPIKANNKELFTFKEDMIKK